VSLIKNIIATKMGRNGAVARYRILVHFPKKKSAKRGAKKGGIPSSTKFGFQHPRRFFIIKEVLLSCFEVKRDPG
jgi:hypothetical protein